MVVAKAPSVLRGRLADGAALFGGWCTTPSTFTAEVLAGEGYDYIGFDCQHGLIHVGSVWRLLQAVRWSPVMPIVRVPVGTPDAIGRALDAGASGVIVPMVERADQAEAAAAACRYPPEGVRSFGTVRASMLLGGEPAVVNRAVSCLVMIETARGVDEVERICSTPGVDGVYIGPTDLALSMGVAPGEQFRGEHLAAIDTVLEACGRHEVIAGIHAGTATRGHELAQRGFQLCTLASDVALLRSGTRAALDEARGLAG